MDLEVLDDVPGAAVELFLAESPSTVALSGGRTPQATYERLAAANFDWAHTDVFFGDERCVAADDPDSNLRMANEALLSHVPARVHPMTGCRPAAYESELAGVFGPGVPKFDFMFLGLGEDGHTASLFPGNPVLDITDRNVALVERPDHRRMSLTLPVLCAARIAVFLVEGESKQASLTSLLAGGDIPAARVKASRVVVLADRAASRSAGG